MVDCPPSLLTLTINVLSTANQVLIPVNAEYLPAKGMTKLLGTINKVKAQLNPKLEILGVAITMSDMSTNMAKSTVDALKTSFGQHFRIFNSIIPGTVKEKIIHFATYQNIYFGGYVIIFLLKLNPR